MTTAVKVINLGLSKFAASRVSSIAPPRTNLEQFMADNYPQWKREMISTKRWNFAEEYRTLTATPATQETYDKPHRYPMPNDALRPVREKRSEWVQRGTSLYSAFSTLTVLFLIDKPETDFDPLFTNVLAERVGVGSVEYVTQSSTKAGTRDAALTAALRVAASMNAFVTGSEALSDEQDEGNAESFSWLSSRYQ